MTCPPLIQASALGIGAIVGVAALRALCARRAAFIDVGRTLDVGLVTVLAGSLGIAACRDDPWMVTFAHGAFITAAVVVAALDLVERQVPNTVLGVSYSVVLGLFLLVATRRAYLLRAGGFQVRPVRGLVVALLALAYVAAYVDFTTCQTGLACLKA